MDGRIVSVREVENEEGGRHREILIKIPEPSPSMPYQPINYIPDWRAVQKQQSPFTEENLKTFVEYEGGMKKYDRICGMLDAFHIGGVAITQAEVKE